MAQLTDRIVFAYSKNSHPTDDERNILRSRLKPGDRYFWRNGSLWGFDENADPAGDECLERTKPADKKINLVVVHPNRTGTRIALAYRAHGVEVVFFDMEKVPAAPEISTVKQLKAFLDKHKIPYDKQARKADLAALVGYHQEIANLT